ncbi:MAG TPA: 50S ribosomal protein L17 [Thermoanaerobaculia bacterium]|nr:50S ribosomal protein L17 [Thermoanaerobaculia bacterium]
MRHGVKGRKLGRTSAHREALFRNQLQSLMAAERIKTTLPKAKELRPIAERVITHGKHGTVHARRWVLRWIPDRDLVRKVFDEIAPRFAERPGGYLRIVKLGPRKGDGAEMALLELVERADGATAEPTEGGKPAKKPAKRGAMAAAAARLAGVGRRGKAAEAEGEEGEEPKGKPKAKAKGAAKAAKPAKRKQAKPAGGAKKPAKKKPAKREGAAEE